MLISYIYKYIIFHRSSSDLYQIANTKEILAILQSTLLKIIIIHLVVQFVVIALVIHQNPIPAKSGLDHIVVYIWS